MQKKHQDKTDTNANTEPKGMKVLSLEELQSATGGHIRPPEIRPPAKPEYPH